jgi:broad specificity phosphatase PhoE
MRLILVRHGETKWNRENRVVGHIGIALNSNGRRQVELLAKKLKDDSVSAIHSSPLRRARETAAAIARIHGLRVIDDDAFKEIDAGEMEGLTFDEVMERYSGFIEDWMKGSTSLRMPGGESMSDLQQRTWPAVERIVGENPHSVIVLVSHSLAILSIITKALGMAPFNFRRLQVSVASISILNFREHGASLALFNDTCHLERGN